MLRKNIRSSVFVLLALAACTSKNNVKITGGIKEAENQKVYLEQLNVDQAVIIDSTKTDRYGHFTFKTATSLPTFYNVKIGPKEFITFIAEPEDHIELSGTLNGLSQNYWVDGSENSLWVKLLNFQLNNTHVMMDSLKKSFAALPAEATSERQKIAAAWDSIVNKQINFSKDFILNPDNDLHSYKVVASSMKAMYPESQYTKAILNHLDQINKAIQNMKIKQLINNSEGSLPEIHLPNAQGDTIALSSLKGKYILLDFTVLNSKDGVGYIQEMKKIYNKFKNRGVQIYQVCLDPNKLAWQSLVKQLDINWICVWDPDGLKSRAAQMWNIQRVPANYIINPKFEIVGKNLAGQRLEDRLNDLLK